MIKTIQVVIALAFGLIGGAAIDEVRAEAARKAKFDAICEVYSTMNIEQLAAAEL